MASEPVDVDPATIRRVLKDATGSVEALADALERRGDTLHRLAGEVRKALEKGEGQ